MNINGISLQKNCCPRRKDWIPTGIPSSELLRCHGRSSMFTPDRRFPGKHQHIWKFGQIWGGGSQKLVKKKTNWTHRHLRIARTWEPIFSSIVSCHNRMSRVVLCTTTTTTTTNVTAIWGCYSSAVLTCSKMFNIFHHLSAKRMASSHGFPTASSPQSTAMCWAPDIGNHEILEVWTGVNNRTWGI